MRNATVWRVLLGVERTVLEEVVFDEDAGVVAHVRPSRRARGRCGRCGRGAGMTVVRAGGSGGGLDLGTVPVWLEADVPRVNCREHGPTVVAVPWARHDAGHTLEFDTQVAWLATQTSKSAVHEVDADRVADGRGDHHPGLG